MSEPSPNVPAEFVWRSNPLASDVEAVRALVAAAGVFSDEEVATAAELVDEARRGGAAAGYEFVFAERGGALVGYTCFGPIPLTAGSYDLYWIAVDSSERKRGLGRALLERSEARIRTIGGVRVYIDTSSRAEYAPAHRLYQSAGYAEAARLEGFYAPGDAKLIFARELGA